MHTQHEDNTIGSGFMNNHFSYSWNLHSWFSMDTLNGYYLTILSEPPEHTTIQKAFIAI